MLCGDTGGLTAHGEKCKRPLSPGFSRCSLHGARTPASILKAENAMALARMPAIESLYLILEQFSGHTCKACGYPDGSAEEKRMIVRTCTAVLDRTGMGSKSTLEITQSMDGALNLELLTEDERVELLGLVHRIKAIKGAIRQRQLGPVTNPIVLPDITIVAQPMPAPPPLPLVVRPAAPPEPPLVGSVAARRPVLPKRSDDGA